MPAIITRVRNISSKRDNFESEFGGRGSINDTKTIDIN